MVKSTNTLMKLDAEDKEWLGSLFTRLDTKIDGMESRLDAKIDAVEKRLDARIDNLDLKIEKVETSLLTEFHKWASPHDARMRQLKAAFLAIELELEALSDRVSKLESSRPN